MQKNNNNRKSFSGQKTNWSRTKPEGLKKDQTPKATRKLITQEFQTPSLANPQIGEEQSKGSSGNSSKSETIIKSSSSC